MEFWGELCALLTATSWSLSSYIFTAVALRVGTIQLIISRLIISAVFLAITLLAFRINLSAQPVQIFYLALSGFIGLVIGDTFLFKSFETIGPRLSLLIMSINPGIAAVLAYLVIGETLGWFAILGMVVTLSGIFLVILERKPGTENTKFKITKKGVIYALIGAAGQGVGVIFAKMAYIAGDINGLYATFIRVVTATIILIPLFIILKKYKNPLKVYREDIKSLGMVLIGSVIGPYVGITLSFFAIIYAKIGIATTLMSTIPIIMLPLSIAIHKEKLSWKSVAGAFITVIGVAILFIK